jgi:hypothetical protein
MEKAVIRAKLDLLIMLKDSTTGFAVDERNVRFIRDGESITASPRGEGSYVFINIGRENCLMQVIVYGYEPQTLKVDYEELDSILPSIDVFLIPSENTSKGEALITLKGRLSGLERLEAIHPGRAVTTIRELDQKKRIMTVFAPNRRVNLTDGRYGVFNAEKTTFEVIEIEEELSEKKFRIRKNPDEEILPNSQICRIIYGQIWEDGTYLFRIRDDGKNLRYLIKYVVNGQIRYKKVDFAESEITGLD